MDDEKLEIVLRVKEDLKGFREFIKEAEKAKQEALKTVSGIDKIKASLSGVVGVARKAAAALKKIGTAPVKAIIGLKNAVVELGNKAKWAFTLIVAVTATMGRKAVNAASDASESLSKLGAVYGSTTDIVIEKARAMQKELGLSYYSIAEDFGDIGALLKGFGMNAEKAAEESEKALRTAYDLASYHNISFSEAMNKIRAGLTGETEPLKHVGIIVLEDQMKAYAKTLGLTWKKLTIAEKAQLRLDTIFNQAVAQGAVGDHTRTMHLYAGQVRILSENFKTLATTLGDKFKGVVLPIIQELNKNFNSIFSEENVSKALKMTAGIITITGAIAALGTALTVLSSPGGALAFLAVGAAPIMYEAWKENVGGVQGLFNNLFKNITEQLNEWYRSFKEMYFKINGLINKNKLESLTKSRQSMEKAVGLATSGASIPHYDIQRAIMDAGLASEETNRLLDMLGAAWEDRKITFEEFESIFKEYQISTTKLSDELEGRAKELEEGYTSTIDKTIGDDLKVAGAKYKKQWESFLKDTVNFTGELGEAVLKELKELLETRLGITIDVSGGSLSPTGQGAPPGPDVGGAAKTTWQDKFIKGLPETTKSLTQLSTSVYQVADLLQSDFMDSVSGVMSGLAGVSGSMETMAKGGGMNSLIGILGLGSSMGGIAGAFGGNAQGGTIGGLIGGGLGMAVGGPIGAAIGSAAGGAIGGMIGGDDDEASKRAEIERESAKIQQAAAQEFSKAVDKFKEDVVDKGLAEVFQTVSKLKKADASYSEVLSSLQQGRRRSDEVTVESFKRFLPTLESTGELMQFVKASIGKAHYIYKGGEYRIDTGKGKRGGIDIETLARAIVGYNDNLLEGFENTMETIIGFTKDSVREGVKSGFEEGNIEDILTKQVSDSLLNVFSNTKIFNQAAIGVSDTMTDLISEALKKDENMGVSMPKAGFDNIKDYIEWFKKYQEVATEEINKIKEELGLMPTHIAKAAQELKGFLSKAMSDALSANDFNKFNSSLGESIYNSVKSSLIKAFTESATYKKYIDKFMNTGDMEDELSKAGSFKEAYEIMQKHLQKMEEKLRGEGLSFGTTEGGSTGEKPDWTTGSHFEKEAKTVITHNHYYYEPKIENLFGEEKEQVYQGFLDFKRDMEVETV